MHWLPGTPSPVALDALALAPLKPPGAARSPRKLHVSRGCSRGWGAPAVGVRSPQLTRPHRPSLALTEFLSSSRGISCSLPALVSSASTPPAKAQKALLDATPSNLSPTPLPRASITQTAGQPATAAARVRHCELVASQPSALAPLRALLTALKARRVSLAFGSHGERLLPPSPLVARSHFRSVQLAARHRALHPLQSSLLPPPPLAPCPRLQSVLHGDRPAAAMALP